MTLTVKQKIVSLLAEARDLADELSIDGLAYGEGADEAFGEVFEALEQAQNCVLYYADGDGA